MRTSLILFFYCLLPGLLAQPVIGPMMVQSAFPSAITSASVDRLGNFYLSGNGKLIRLDPQGNASKQVDLPVSRGMELLESWNPLRIWNFHEGQPHQAMVLNSALETSADSVRIDPAMAIRPLLIAPAILNSNCWILDMDYSVKYLNLVTNALMLETAPLVAPDQDPGFLFMRAYQNLLFLLTRNKGILVMNMTGQVIRSIPAEGARHFGVLGEDIYFRRGEKLVFVNLYSGDEAAVKLPSLGDFVLANDERLLIASGNRYSVYHFTPPK